ncbi:hypothetical protein SAMN05446589_3040 [Streptomyces sp. OV198]|jgi:hypothetical protein|nr:hypothetical protein BX281_4465 [Streptomyces sp. Ag82_O1-15]SOE67402.1 hypothetical protein SAMN05446589_3040 [Streptomyces sp. OV198]
MDKRIQPQQNLLALLRLPRLWPTLGDRPPGGIRHW